MNVLLVAAFGAAGALARYGVDSALIGSSATGRFPLDTFIVNVAGSFALGVLVALTTERMLLDESWRIALGIGFLGSFTTFSTYTVESIRLAEDSQWLLAFVNVFGMLAVGLIFAIAGLALGRAL
jgi:fluoride exporter